MGRRSTQLDNWFKIVMPVLIVILIIVAAVSITLAVTAGNTAKQIASASYTPSGKADVQLAQGGACPNCPGYGKVDDNNTSNQGTATAPGYANSGYQSSSCCTANSSQSNSSPRGYTGGGCCGGR